VKTAADRLGSPCGSCKKPVPFGKMRCVFCGAWNFGLGDDGEESECVRLSDARVSIVPRLRTLHPDMDRFFGGKPEDPGVTRLSGAAPTQGLVQTSTCLVAGAPGSGKTTMFLQLADCISAQCLDKRGEYRDVIYIANEQSADEIRAKALEIGIKRLHQIVIVKTMGGLRGNLWEICERYSPCLMIVDSLSKLVGRDMELAVLVASQMKELSVRLNCPTLLVNQVTKSLDHAGLEKLQHEVDMTCLIQTLGPKRVMESEKNRNGQAPLGLVLEMKGPEDFARGQGGLRVLGCEEPGEEDGDDGDGDGDDGDPPISRIGEGDVDRPLRGGERP
jgi:predicted ATP-dependent serine protease